MLVGHSFILPKERTIVINSDSFTVRATVRLVTINAQIGTVVRGRDRTSTGRRRGMDRLLQGKVPFCFGDFVGRTEKGKRIRRVSVRVPSRIVALGISLVYVSKNEVPVLSIFCRLKYSFNFRRRLNN